MYSVSSGQFEFQSMCEGFPLECEYVINESLVIKDVIRKSMNAVESCKFECD